MHARTVTRFTATRAAPRVVEPLDVSPSQRRNNMRLTPLVLTAWVFSVSAPLFAQEWVEFASREDRFTCLFPTQPKVMETKYLSQHEANLPARVYSATQGKSTYKVTVVDYNQARPILAEGRTLQLTNNADQSRSFVGLFMHENKLYITEGTVPKGYPEPALFQNSLGWLDENGIGLRYTTTYNNSYPPPPLVNRSNRPGQGRIDAPGAVTPGK